MVLSFRCPHCQAPCTAPPEMAGRKAKCLKCAQVLVIPNPERDRWPPGMEPPGLKQPTAQPPQSKRPAANQPAAAPAKKAQPAAAAVPRAQAVASESPQAEQAPIVAPQQRAGQAIPVAKAVPASQPSPAAKPPLLPVAETVPDDLDAFLELERAAPAIESNPYRAPQTAQAQPATVGPDGIRRITYGEVFATACQIFKLHGMAMIGATLVSVLTVGVVLIVLRVVLVGLASGIVALEMGSITIALVLIAGYLLALYSAVVILGMGYLRYCVLLGRGKLASLSTLFATSSLVPAAVVVLVMFMAMVVGSILLVVPGIVAGVLLAVAPIALADRECGAIEALKLSVRIMSANFLTGFLVQFSSGLLGTLLVGVTCGLGTLVVIPFQVALLTAIYLRATGRRTAID